MAGKPVPLLKQIREDQFMSRRELAAKAGLGHVCIWYIESGRGAQLKTIRQLAEALGVEPSELVEEQS